MQQLSTALLLKRLLFFVVAATLLTVAMARSASADPQHSITVAPAVNRLSVAEGKTTSDSFMVINRSSAPVELSVASAVYTVNEQSYEPNYELALGSGSPADWVSIEGSIPATLDSEADAVVEFSIDIPDGTSAGGYVASLLVETRPVSSSTGVTASYRIAHLIYIDVEGEVVRAGTVASPTLPWVISSTQQTIEFTAKNNGGTNEKAVLGISVEDVFGRKLLDNQVERYVLPATSRLIELSWRPGGVLGIYKITRTCDFAGKDCGFGTSWQLYVHPLGAVLVAAVGSLYTGYMIWWHSHKRKSQR